MNSKLELDSATASVNPLTMEPDSDLRNGQPEVAHCGSLANGNPRTQEGSRKRKQDLSKHKLRNDNDVRYKRPKKRSLLLYEMDEDDPNHAEETKRRIIKSKKCRNFRMKQEDKLQNLTAELAAEKQKSVQLEERNRELEEKVRVLEDFEATCPFFVVSEPN